MSHEVLGHRRFREALYGVLALAGLLGPWYFNVQYVTGGGNPADIAGALMLAFANPVSASLSLDLLIAFAAFALWAGPEARRVGMRSGWLYPVIGLLIAFAFAFPLFLFLRERRLGYELRGS